MFDFFNAGRNCSLVASTANDCCIVLVNLYRFCLTKNRNVSSFKFKSNFFRNYCTACKNCDVLKHILSAIAKTRSLDSTAFDCSTNCVQYQSCKGFSINIFCNDYKSTTCICNFFKQRQQIFHCRNLFVVNKNKSIFIRSFHCFAVCYKI